MLHEENARRILAEWQSRPREAGAIRGFVYESDGGLAYFGNYSATDYAGIPGAAAQLGREASLFTADAHSMALVADICVMGTDRTLPIWCGSVRGGTSASAVTSDSVDRF